jgi:GT2 family glycosyltransferase
VAASRADLTSIIVVAADSGPLLRACLASALASDADIEVVLVDNASGDGEVDRAERAHAHDPRLRVLRNGANLGFGAACNRGATLARGDRLLFLNPDCELPADAVARLRDALRAHPAIGVLGADVRDPSGRPGRGARRREPTFRRALASLSGLSRWQGRWPALAGVEMPPPHDPGVETVDAVSGACLMLPRAVFDRVGGFDEGYFLHAEDLDLCRRVRDAGWRVALAHGVGVAHAAGSSGRGRALFVARHKHRGFWRYFRTHDPAARNPLLRALVAAGLWLHFAATAPCLLWRDRAARRR